MDVRFVDTTFRDGSQSIWASYIRTGMIEAVADEMEQAGLDVIEVPVIGIYFKKFIREMKEDPWDMVRMVAKKMPGAVKACMTPAGFHPFEAPPPRAVMELHGCKHSLACKRHLMQLGIMGMVSMKSGLREEHTCQRIEWMRILTMEKQKLTTVQSCLFLGGMWKFWGDLLRGGRR